MSLWAKCPARLCDTWENDYNLVLKSKHLIWTLRHLLHSAINTAHKQNKEKLCAVKTVNSIFPAGDRKRTVLPVFLALYFRACRPNIARGTTDPEIESLVTINSLGGNRGEGECRKVRRSEEGEGFSEVDWNIAILQGLETNIFLTWYKHTSNAQIIYQSDNWKFRDMCI